MAKDYAKHTRYTYVPARNRYQRIRAQVWLAVCSIAVLILLANVFVERKAIIAFTQRPAVKEFTAKMTAMLTHHKKDVNGAKLASNVNKAEQAPAVHFDFYSALPNMKMNIDTLAEASKPATTALPLPKATKQYMVQVGTYASAASATEMRMSLMISGFEASVVKVKVGNKDQYRVQRGPYPKMASAKADQQALYKQGIDSEIAEWS